jgi:F0F1-type ATP synthase membrane subunit b/b'
MLFTIDGTFIVQLLNFAIFFALLNGIFLRPVARAVRERRAYIDSLSSDYAKYQEQADELRREAEAVRAGARREAEQLLAKGRADASNRAADLAGDYAKQAQAIVEEAHRKAEGELEQARSGEDRLVKSLAEEILQRSFPELTA